MFKLIESTIKKIDSMDVNKDIKNSLVSMLGISGILVWLIFMVSFALFMINIFV